MQSDVWGHGYYKRAAEPQCRKTESWCFLYNYKIKVRIKTESNKTYRNENVMRKIK